MTNLTLSLHHGQGPHVPFCYVMIQLLRHVTAKGGGVHYDSALPATTRAPAAAPVVGPTVGLAVRPSYRPAMGPSREGGLIGYNIKVCQVDLGEVMVGRVPANQTCDLGVDREQGARIEVLAQGID